MFRSKSPALSRFLNQGSGSPFPFNACRRNASTNSGDNTGTRRSSRSLQRLPNQGALFRNDHFFGFGREQFIDRQAGGDRRYEQASHPGGQALIQAGTAVLPKIGSA